MEPWRSRTRVGVFVRGPGQVGEAIHETSRERTPADGTDFTGEFLTYCASSGHAIRGKEEIGGVCSCGRVLCAACAQLRCLVCGRIACTQCGTLFDDGMVCRRRHGLQSFLLGLIGSR